MEKVTKFLLAQGGVGTQPKGIELPNPLKVQNIADLLDRIVGFLQTIAIPIVAIMVIWGGFQMLFATGDPEKFKTGKKTIIYAAIGFAVILIAKGVTSIVKDLLQ